MKKWEIFAMYVGFIFGSSVTFLIIDSIFGLLSIWVGFTVGSMILCFIHKER